jgi:hypothetical protein
LLIEAGHGNPWGYTIGRLTDEANIADHRIMGRIATQAMLFQMAISTQPPELTKPAIRSAKTAAQNFKNVVDKMLNGS